MRNDLINKNEEPATEPIVIADECGDSMWDAVLEEKDKVCEVKGVSKNAFLLHSYIGRPEECDATETK
jgi:hypothetical protein